MIIDTDDVKTVWDLLAYLAEHRDEIFVRHEDKKFALSKLGDDLACAWVIEFVQKWLHSGWVPVRVLPEPASEKVAPTITSAGPVHRLHHGVAACVDVMPAVRGLPNTWPAGHRWSTDWGEVTCLACLLYAPGPDE